MQFKEQCDVVLLYSNNGIDTIIDYDKLVLDFGVEAAAGAFNNNDFQGNHSYELLREHNMTISSSLM